jgi:hypothetical protein
MKNSSDTIGNRSCDLPVCSSVPQPLCHQQRTPTSDSINIIHLFSSFTKGPNPLPKPALHTVRSRASSFRCEYPLLSLRSSSGFLRLLLRLPITSIPPIIFPSGSFYAKCKYICTLKYSASIWQRNPIKMRFVAGEESVKLRIRPKGSFRFGCPVDEREDISFLLYTR